MSARLQEVAGTRFPRAAVVRSLLQAQDLDLAYVALPAECLVEINGELPIELNRCAHEWTRHDIAVTFVCMLPADRCLDDECHGYDVAVLAPYSL